MPPVDWLGLYLEEDLGPGDITANALFGEGDLGRARIVARERAVLAGLTHAVTIFTRLGATAKPLSKEGLWVPAGTPVLALEGPTRALLAGERLSLNLMSRMSGIASQTRELAEQLTRDCAPALVAGTRKTTPGFRAFEKEAIRLGGGDPHRMGLYDEAMVKDNHIAAAGSAGAAVRKVKAANPGKVVSCEAESLIDAQEAARAGADWVLIDNQPPETGHAWAKALWDEFPQLKVEASGGITPDTVASYGWADRVSLGWLTQKAQGKDFGLDWDSPDAGQTGRMEETA